MLLIKIFEVERYWAYAMHLKQKIPQSIMDTKRAQKVMKDKFKQAAKVAEEFFGLCQLKLPNDNTVLEAEAYYLFLKGQSLIEDDKPGEAENMFKEALRCMYKANELYIILQKDKDPLAQILYKERINQIEPFIRLSLFKMGTDQEKSKKYYEELKEKIKKDIEKQMEKIKKEKSVKVKENYVEVHYGGKTIPLNTEALQLLYKQITQQLKDIETGSNSQETIKLYSKLLTTIGKWTEEVKREKAEEFKKSEGSAQLYNTLIDYTNGLKADIVIKKLKLLVSDIKNKFDKENNLVKLLKKKKSPKEASTVGKIVILFINLSKKVKQIKNFEKDFIDHKKMSGYEIQERVYRLLLLYYKAIYYALNNKLDEANYIAKAVADEQKKAVEYCKVNEFSIIKKDEFFNEAMSIGPKAKKLAFLVQCINMMRANLKKENKIETPEAKKARRSMKYKDAIQLIEQDLGSSARLNSWIFNLEKAPKDLITPKGVSGPTKLMAETIALPTDAKKIRIVDKLPHLKMLHVKPFLHDLARSFVKMPSLEGKEEQPQKKGGIMGWIFGS